MEEIDYKKKYERILEINRKWCDQNKEKLKENHKKYYVRNKKEICERNKKYREEHSDRITCGCGSVYVLYDRSKHFKTQKHQLYLFRSELIEKIQLKGNS